MSETTYMLKLEQKRCPECLIDFFVEMSNVNKKFTRFQLRFILGNFFDTINLTSISIETFKENVIVHNLSDFVRCSFE